MPNLPESIERFLQSSRIAVAGVSRQGGVGNVVLKRLRASGHEVVAINPHASELEGAACFPDVRSVPGPLAAVFFAGHPRVARETVEQCAERGVRTIWFHRSFGEGSVSEDAVAACRTLGVEAIVGGCPLMYCAPVDFGHRFMCWWLRRRGRVPS